MQGAVTSAFSVWDLAAARASATPDAMLAIDDRGETLTFDAYERRAEAVAAGFAALGVGEGTPVSWVLPTWLESMVLAGALSRLGAIQNPILPVYREREIGFCVRQTAASVLVVPTTWRGVDYGSIASGIAETVPGLRVVAVDPATRALPTADPNDLPPEPPAGGIRWHFYTSGTTSDPKGVRHTDASITAAAVAVNESVDIGRNDRMGVVFPYTHVGGIGLLVGAFVAGYGQIITEAFDPATTIPLLRDHGVTVAGAGTVFWNAYLDAQSRTPAEPLFPRLRALVGGGSAKPAGLNDRVRTELGGRGTVSGYGLTECPSCVLCSIDDPDDKLARTDGRPVSGVELRVVDEAGGLCGPEVEGELRVRGPMLFAGYVDSTLDADAFDDEGWLRTGDLGVVDADGYVRVTGRLKEIIIRKGENISAREVQEVLLLAPSVRDVVVVGIPDPERGEMACAFVVPSDPESPPTLPALAALCADLGLARYKVPERLVIVEALPRNPTGKVLRDVLRDSVVGAA
jgi:acyl-CoA synthetase (AMP-forming)/AMP-acid ligase II